MNRWLLVGVLLLSGCATEPVTVKVPVPVPCREPPTVQRPFLPLADLTEHSTPAQTMRAYRASVEVLGGYADELETILDGYRKDVHQGN